MNILLWNTTDFWVPTYVFNDDSYLSWGNIPYFLSVILAMFTCSWLSFYMTIVILEVRKFHGNATYLLACIYACWFENFIGSLVILPYKYGIVHLAAPGRIIEGFENTEDYLILDEITWKSVPILVASFLEWHYLGLINSGFACLLLERTLATLLFSDYESASRKKLSICLVIFHQTSSLLMAFSMIFHIFPLKNLLLMNVFGLVFLVPYLFLLRYYNIRARNNMRLAKNITKNTLAAKFQTEENVRSIHLAFRIFLMIIFFNVTCLVIIFLAIFKVPGERYYFQAAEHIIFFGPIYLVPAVVSTERDWRKRFFYYVPVNKLRIRPENPESEFQVPTVAAQTTAIHFEQLENLWV
ncbi:CBN-SRE-36 protein [Caenorhabditis brenneri]|uniref:CBN-SRE-36 protein n=1 Tax=Caenorhabditis brenneri TaxID=135651 RepID=G0N134_CAEBE|nr:CBN-SRE-36 protein [Caenorhabditis brenneri]